MKLIWWPVLQRLPQDHQQWHQCGEAASETVVRGVQTERNWVHPLRFLWSREHEKEYRTVSVSWEDQRHAQKSISNQDVPFIRRGQILSKYINLLLATVMGNYIKFSLSRTIVQDSVHTYFLPLLKIRVFISRFVVYKILCCSLNRKSLFQEMSKPHFRCTKMKFCHSELKNGYVE